MSTLTLATVCVYDRNIYICVCLYISMTNQDQRFNRISLILDAVKQVEEKKGVGTNKESLINYFSDYFKLSKVKVREYVKELIEKGKVEERGSELFISTGNNTDFQEVLGL